MNNQSEIRFLGGPHSRWKELKFAASIFFEFIKGFRALHFTGPCITVFGSARFSSTHPYYEKTRILSQQIARLGFTIMTGGGPGIMEAANKGAKEVGGKSVGCNIILPKEQKPNKYLDKWVDINHFFVRKTLLIKYSYAFIVMPGGFGTLDEYFEALTLIQTKKINNFPVIVMCKDFYETLIAHLNHMQLSGTIDKSDLDLFFYTDSIDEVIEILKEKSIGQYGLKEKIQKPAWWLFEKRVTKKEEIGIKD
jgi:uncharacterized protein (TIGR00730 family)